MIKIELPTPKTLDELISQLDLLLPSYCQHNKGIVDVSGLAGFFVGLQSAPNPVRASKWFSLIFGGKAHLPNWDNQSADVFVKRLMLFYDFIKVDLQQSVKQGNYYPLFIKRVYTDKTFIMVEDWCHGYDLARSCWHLNKADILVLQQLLAPLDLFICEAGQRYIEALPLPKLTQLQQKIAPAVLRVYQLYGYQH